MMGEGGVVGQAWPKDSMSPPQELEGKGLEGELARLFEDEELEEESDAGLERTDPASSLTTPARPRALAFPLPAAAPPLLVPWSPSR